MKTPWQHHKQPDQTEMPCVATCCPGQHEFIHDHRAFYVKGKTKVKRVGNEVTRTQSIAWYWCLGGHVEEHPEISLETLDSRRRSV